ncbi:hypothetical protein EB796_010659 [Bugula neritina]|uniref:Uncharacterized protein n=1 Tax=Bugula neritina TaxID=10212 RepID=A0A7J7JX95_BUGNE|nr:hypothetical protein EB796_010659 [Bugula neritina]
MFITFLKLEFSHQGAAELSVVSRQQRVSRLTAAACDYNNSEHQFDNKKQFIVFRKNYGDYNNDLIIYQSIAQGKQLPNASCNGNEDSTNR